MWQKSGKNIHYGGVNHRFERPSGGSAQAIPEEKGAELLKKLGITKSEFARRMGIQRKEIK